MKLRFTLGGGLGLALAALSVAIVAAAPTEQQPFNVGAGKTKENSATCDRGKTPSGGGFTLDQSTSGFRLHSSNPAGTRWGVKVSNTSAGPLHGTAIAICSRDDDLFVRTKTETFGGGAGGEAQATARCPRGSKAVGGGGEGPGRNRFLRGTFPAGDLRSWGARFANLKAEDEVKAFAICDPSPRGIRFVQDSSSASRAQRGFQTLVADAACPAGAEVLGGGFSSTDASTLYQVALPLRRDWRVGASVLRGGTLIAYGVCQT